VNVGEAYLDILAIDENGREIRIELEFESATFEREHASQAEECDHVVCWRDS
jgi:acyl-CoA hydrolase